MENEQTLEIKAELAAERIVSARGIGEVYDIKFQGPQTINRSDQVSDMFAAIKSYIREHNAYPQSVTINYKLSFSKQNIPVETSRENAGVVN